MRNARAYTNFESFRECFESRVCPEPNTGCWLWTAGHSGRGYGMLGVPNWLRREGGPKTVYAHRVSWELYRGAIGELWVLHKCDTPQCVNPDHLYLGTFRENFADVMVRDRMRQPLLNKERQALRRVTATGLLTRAQLAWAFEVTLPVVDRTLFSLGRVDDSDDPPEKPPEGLHGRRKRRWNA